MDALSLLARAHDAGLAVAIVGDKLVVRGPQRAEPLVRLLAVHKPAVMAALAADWQARHCEALVYWRALHPADEAERLAWGELEDRWHRLHGHCVPQWQCAGCRKPIGGLPVLDLSDRKRVHFDGAHGLDCLFAFGERWRGEATAGLRALRLDPPPSDEPS
jgi:hypothetical protein